MLRQDRRCKPSALRDYRSNLDAHLTPFGDSVLLEITPGAIDSWRASLSGLSASARPGPLKQVLLARTRSEAIGSRECCCRGWHCGGLAAVPAV
jgi:hypothetical protein